MLKNLLKKIANYLWSGRRPIIDSRIIYYHSIGESMPLSQSTQAFSEQVSWLKANGVTGTTIDEYTSRSGKLGTHRLAISFDDGYANNLEVAAPILSDAGFDATIFVVTDFVGKNGRVNSDRRNNLYKDHAMLSRNDLLDLQALGFEIGSHTCSHRMLTQMPLHEAREELYQSKQILEDWIGTEVRSFAFPNGQRGAYSSGLIEIGRKVGYKNISTTMWGCHGENEPCPAFNRCEISATDSLNDFKAKIQGFREYRKYVDRFIDKSKVWGRKG